ncbi:MAG: hypothetical protein B7Z66_07610 [Chromatiales bacterium 21-64-14]|nr:MAG: hypothetical protein B7Z66_07610 [Chromatiales bacterium 21-64-14]HQU15921.1 DsrE family protein [Gammaproteobacteria bacterium]
MKAIRIALPAIISLVALTWLQTARAEDWSLFKNYDFNKAQVVKEIPFAKQHLVIQVSQGDPGRWGLVLNNVHNVIKYFGQDKIQVVVVAYGPGLKMLFKNSPDAQRVAGLSAAGVEFDACHATMLSIEKKTGHLPPLLPSAVVVPGGLVRIMQLQDHGYNYLKP